MVKECLNVIGFDFSKKNYIVTGGAGGMGREVVRGIVAGGGNVALVDINEEAAREVCAEAPQQIRYYHMDISDHEDIRKVTAQIIADMGQVHGLVNLAGIVDTTKFADMTDEIWDRVMNLNLTSQYVIIHSLFRHMAEHHYGRIVNVSSVAAKVGGGLFGTTAYAVSKAGVICLTKGVAKRALRMGSLATRSARDMSIHRWWLGFPLSSRVKFWTGNLLHRRAEPREVAILMLFYLSDLASFITGEIGDADAGVTLD